MTTLAVSILGIMVAGAGIIVAAHGRQAHSAEQQSGSGRRKRSSQVSRRALAGAGLAAVIVGLLTRWPVAAALAGAAAGFLPSLLGATSGEKDTERIEAIAVWTELLRDTLAAAAGLSQAIMATAALAPRPIRGAVGALADRLAGGVAMDEALASFADEVDDAGADQVVCALTLAASSQGQRLGDVLGALADSTREVVAMRLRVEASRASARSGVRTVVVFSLAFAAALFVLAHSYLTPFASASGELVLGLVGVLYAAGLGLMVRMVRRAPQARVFVASGASR